MIHQRLPSDYIAIDKSAVDACLISLETKTHTLK